MGIFNYLFPSDKAKNNEKSQKLLNPDSTQEEKDQAIKGQAALITAKYSMQPQKAFLDFIDDSYDSDDEPDSISPQSYKTLLANSTQPDQEKQPPKNNQEQQLEIAQANVNLDRKLKSFLTSTVGLGLLTAGFLVLTLLTFGIPVASLTAIMIFTFLAASELLTAFMSGIKIADKRTSEALDAITKGPKVKKTGIFSYLKIIPSLLASAGATVMTLIQLGTIAETAVLGTIGSAVTLTWGALVPILFVIPLFYGMCYSIYEARKAYHKQMKECYDDDGKQRPVKTLWKAFFSAKVLTKLAKAVGFAAGTAGIVALSTIVFSGVSLAKIGLLIGTIGATTIGFPVATALLGLATIVAIGYTTYLNWDNIKNTCASIFGMNQDNSYTPLIPEDQLNPLSPRYDLPSDQHNDKNGKHVTFSSKLSPPNNASAVPENSTNNTQDSTTQIAAALTDSNPEANEQPIEENVTSTLPDFEQKRKTAKDDLINSSPFLKTAMQPKEDKENQPPTQTANNFSIDHDMI